MFVRKTQRGQNFVDCMFPSVSVSRGARVMAAAVERATYTCCDNQYNEIYTEYETLTSSQSTCCTMQAHSAILSAVLGKLEC